MHGQWTRSAGSHFGHNALIAAIFEKVTITAKLQHNLPPANTDFVLTNRIKQFRVYRTLEYTKHHICNIRASISNCHH
jgi:hypothetical protein